MAPTRTLLLFTLALVLAGCSERSLPAARPTASLAQASARCERPGPVISVVPVHVAGGFEMQRAGGSASVQDGLLIEVGGLDWFAFVPRALPGPVFVWGNGRADLVIDPLVTPSRATLLVPRPSSGDEAVLWLLDWRTARENTSLPAGEAQRAGPSQEQDCFVVPVPAPTVEPRSYASREALQFDVLPQSLSREQCMQELGKECGVMLRTRLGPLTCGDCPAGQVCSAENRCTGGPAPARP